MGFFCKKATSYYSEGDKQIDIWMTVNEPFDNDAGDVRPQSKSVYMKMGNENYKFDGVHYVPKYITTAFRKAREGHPNAVLLLNERHNERINRGKADPCFRLVKKLKDEGIPIDAVAFQMHMEIGTDERSQK